MKTIEDLGQGTIRRIDWQELLPGVLLFRALILAFHTGPILLGTFLVILMMLLTGITPWTGDFSVVLFKSLVCPSCCSGTRLAGFVIFAIVALLLWLLMARRGAVRLLTTERVPFFQAVQFVWEKGSSFLFAVNIPLFTMLFCIGLLRFGGSGTWLYTVGTPILLVVSWFCLLVMFGLLVGLPMMAAAVAVDNCDGFDSFSRAFSYAFQRLFHTIGYLALGTIFGAAGFCLLRGGVTAVGYIADLFNVSGMPCETLVSDNIWSMFWWSVGAMLPYGFLFSYVCYAGVALYVILRKSLDGVAFESVFIKSDGQAHRLRPILQDLQGAPEPEPDQPQSESESTVREAEDEGQQERV